jgi:hypothetical protein
MGKRNTLDEGLCEIPYLPESELVRHSMGFELPIDRAPATSLALELNMNFRPHPPAPFSGNLRLRRFAKGEGEQTHRAVKVPLPQGEGFRVRAIISPEQCITGCRQRAAYRDRS